jgi:hypothetical protein
VHLGVPTRPGGRATGCRRTSTSSSTPASRRASRKV